MSLSPLEKHVLKRAMKKSMRNMIAHSGIYAQITLKVAFTESLNNFVKVASVN